ncbi:hypothetical protein ABN028_19760 [Actinopolymorpha sp. B17G11]|uniref:hypothetical protein n=1 Tax=Actinopolymorpha sp. B17G11 TaxID=3160861 RepID=UPI0032E3C6A7
MPRAQKDPSHPDFPHGTDRGYWRGCKAGSPCPTTPTCANAHARAVKKAKWRAAGILPPSAASRVDAQSARDHIARLLTYKGASEEAIARAAGLPSVTLNQIRNRGAKKLWRRTSEAILAVTPAAVAAEVRLTPSAPYATKLRALGVLGYSVRWCSQRSGVNASEVALGRRPTITPRVRQALDALFDEISDRPATPADGIPQPIIDRTIREARAAGYHPPACYDDDGELILRAIPGHPWSLFDEQAARKLETLRSYLTGFRTIAQAAEDAGVTEKEVQRVAKAAGIAGLEGKPRRAATAAVLDVIHDADDGHLDIVHAALKLGLLSPHATTAPKDHPGIEAYYAELREQKKPHDGEEAA